MPQTGMDYWTIIGVLVAIIGVFIAWRQLRGPKKDEPKTINEIKGGSRNSQTGGDGTTVNRIENGNDNQQSG